jgi:thymidylate synthase (FAD)
MLAQGNKVELVGIYGDDRTHSLSAWTSTSRNLTEEKIARIPKLLEMLGSEGHGTPFEKSMLHFLVTTDVSCHIQLLKHRVGVSINAESARYKELKDDKFYVPVDWDSEEQERYIQFMENSLKQYHETLERLVAKGIPRKRAKESARFYIPYGNQIVSDISFNFRSFMHFQGLRNKDNAQLEIKHLAEEMLRLVRETGKFDASLKAFGY